MCVVFAPGRRKFTKSASRWRLPHPPHCDMLVWRGFFGLLDRLAMTMAPRSNVCGLSVRDSRRRGCGRLWHGGGLDERLSTGPSFMFEVSALRSGSAARSCPSVRFRFICCAPGVHGAGRRVRTPAKAIRSLRVRVAT